MKDQTLCQWPQSDRAVLVRYSPKPNPFSPHLISQCGCFSLPAPNPCANDPTSPCRCGDSLDACLHSTRISPSQAQSVDGGRVQLQGILSNLALGLDPHTKHTARQSDCVWRLCSGERVPPQETPTLFGSACALVILDSSVRRLCLGHMGEYTLCVASSTFQLTTVHSPSSFCSFHVPTKKPRPARGGQRLQFSKRSGT